MEPKNRKDMNLPVAEELLPEAKLISLSPESATPVAQGAPERSSGPKKKKKQRTAPPWWAIVLANVVLGVICWGGYRLFVTRNDASEVAVKTSADSHTGSAAHDSEKFAADKRPQAARSDPRNLTAENNASSKTTINGTSVVPIGVAPHRETLTPPSEPKSRIDVTKPESSPTPPPPTPAPAAEPDKPHVVKRLPVPSAEKQAAITGQLKEIYGNRLSGKPPEKLALAKELADLAGKTKSTDERFTMLRKAAELARAGGDLDFVFDAIERIAADFELDPLVVKQRMVLQFADEVRELGEYESLGAHTIKLAEEALKQERYDIPLDLARAFRVACERPGGTKYISAARKIEKFYKVVVDRWTAFQEGTAKLASSPDDSVANLAVGWWWCLQQQHFDKGLPYLAKSGIDELNAAAKDELALKSPAASDWARVADAWWAAAQVSKKDEERHALLAHAGHCYEQSLNGLDAGLLRMRVEKRLADLKLDTAGPQTAVAPVAEKLPAAKRETIAASPPAKPKPKKPSHGSGKSGRATAAVANNVPRVSLRGPPYPESYPGAATDKLSIQYAVKEVLKQAGLKYDFNSSRDRTAPVCQRWCQPNIVDQPWPAALAAILSPVGLTYDLNGDTVTLKRR